MLRLCSDSAYKEEAVAFEEECHQEAKKRKAGKAFLTKDPLPRLFAMCKT